MTGQTHARGFTLIELMIVVAIIAILTAIAIPAYQDYAIRAQVTEGVSLTAGAKSAVWDYYSNNGRFPTANVSAGLASSSSIAGTYVSGVNISGGKIKVSFLKDKANRLIRNETLVLSPISHAGSISWSCTPSTMNRRYLPQQCRK